MARTVRTLDKEDFTRMNLPQDHWGAVLSKVQASARTPITNYISKIESLVNRGVGMTLVGPPGTGKTSIACLLAKEARSRAYTAFFTTPSELREFLRNRIAFDSSTTAFERCREVDFLVLDALTTEEFAIKDASGFSLPLFEGLVEFRINARRPTVITTRLNEGQFSVDFKRLRASMRALMPFVPVTGTDLRAELAKSIETELFGPEGSK